MLFSLVSVVSIIWWCRLRRLCSMSAPLGRAFAYAALLLGAQSLAFSQTIQQFSDVGPDRPFFDDVNIMKMRGITDGCNSGVFCPDQYLTRGQMAVLIIRQLYYHINFATRDPNVFLHNSTPYFTDVPPSHQFFRYIQRLRELGITTGCTQTTFCPDDLVSNYQVAIFSVRTKQLIDTSSPMQVGTMNNSMTCPSDFSCYPHFADVPSSAWFFSWGSKVKRTDVARDYLISGLFKRSVLCVNTDSTWSDGDVCNARRTQ